MHPAAHLVWYGCNLLMLLGVPVLLWNHLPNLHLYFGFLFILVATFFPVFLTVMQGQDSILVRREFLGTLPWPCTCTSSRWFHPSDGPAPLRDCLVLQSQPSIPQAGRL